MTVSPGTRLGSYEITTAIGAGGMGEVFRARDTKLNRDVAIKVLPAAFADDPERLARFNREAQTLASLNHPNIATIHGIEEVPPAGGSSGPGSRALVMELVDGEDLSTHIARGPMPIAEALPVARQIAEALEAAHEHGIVHRDLKPANIKVRADGTVKVLDFGLAKAMDPAGASSSHPNVSHSPTMTHQATSAGMIIGTAAYMSPEQAKGKAVDKRTDIWAFGVVLYEMLTGSRLFAAEDVSETLAAVLTRDVNIAALPKDTPPRLKALVRECLVRDSKQRLRDIGDARRLIEQIIAGAPDDRVAPERIEIRSHSRGSAALPWIISILAVLAAVSGRWPGRADPATRPRVPTHVEVAFPADLEPVSSLEQSFILSPDGRLVGITAFKKGARRLHVRRLSSTETVEIGESDGVNLAAFSPDSQSLAFVTNAGALSRTSLADQQRVRLTDGVDLTGGISWGPHDIVFVRSGALWIQPVEGGAPRQLTELDSARGEVAHANPQFLPGGDVLLFSSLTGDPGAQRIEAVSVKGGKRVVVLEGAATPLWSPTGHLLFARAGGLFAVLFDPIGLKVTGTATEVIPRGQIATTIMGGLAVRLSQTGDLIYVPIGYRASRVVSVGRDGSATALPFPRDRFMNPRVSPSGRIVSVEVQSSRIDAYDLDRQTVSRLTPEAPGTVFSLWTRDGKALAYKRFNVPYWSASDGSGRAGAIPKGVTNDFTSGAGPDPDTILSTRVSPKTSADIVLLSISGKFDPKPLIAGPAYEGGAQLSKDNRWILYVSSESGRLETQVRRYPALDRSWRISSGLGVQPRWRADGREIYYRDGENLVAVAFDGSGEEPVIGKPVALFKDEYDLGQGVTIAAWDVMPDGRFIMLSRDAKGEGLRLVLNWTEEMKEIIARGGVQ